MKKVLIGLIAALFLIPTLVFADSSKVKVYLFTKDGCTYCNLQKEYLEGLDGYNTKFEVIEKEMYDESWGISTYYDLGEKVADAFNEAGFKDATHESTPFIVVSDIYAKAGYNTKLEKVIDEAAQKGDKDVVSCFEQGNDDCLKHLTEKDETKVLSNNKFIIWNIITTVICTIVFIIIYLVKSTCDTKKILAAQKHENPVKKLTKKIATKKEK